MSHQRCLMSRGWTVLVTVDKGIRLACHSSHLVCLRPVIRILHNACCSKGCECEGLPTKRSIISLLIMQIKIRGIFCTMNARQHAPDSMLSEDFDAGSGHQTPCICMHAMWCTDDGEQHAPKCPSASSCRRKPSGSQ